MAIPIIADGDILATDFTGTRYYSVHQADFVAQTETTDYEIWTGPTLRLRTGGAGVTARLFAPVHLPHGAIVTSFKVHWYRDDALASGGIILEYINSTGTVFAMAPADSNSTAGDHTVENTIIANATIDNSLYAYYIVMLLISNDNVADVSFYSAIITYTIDNPKP